MKNKKGEAFQLLVGMATSIAAIAVILVVTFLILASGRKEINSIEGNTSAGYNATVSVTESVADGIPVFLPIVIIAGIGAVLIGLVSLFKNR
jgi:hypothetical protein